MAKRLFFYLCLAAAFGGLTAAAATTGGSIFTSLQDGSRLAYDIYGFKSDVYLGAGAGFGAPEGAAGLPDGRYVFQVTDASGKLLLSVDPARCREFDVAGGIMTGAVPAAGCGHATGVDRHNGALGGRSVQLCGGGNADSMAPTACFTDTVAGGEYKVWVTLEGDYVDGCAQLGKANALAEIDCGAKTKTRLHGFDPRTSRIQNFKIGGQPRAVVTRFYGLAGSFVDGMPVTWTDPLDGSNTVYSYEDAALDLHHEARVDNVEIGTHEITVGNQPGCAIGTIYVGGKRQPKSGPQTVTVNVQSHWGDWSGAIFVDVYCR